MQEKDERTPDTSGMTTLQYQQIVEDIRKVVNPEAMANPGCLGWYAEQAAQANAA